MTPNLNANPLAALIANATKTNAGTDTPLDPGAGLAAQSGENTETDSKFFNILQIHKGLSSGPLEGVAVGEQAPFATVSGALHGQAQPVPGLTIQPQAANALSQHKQSLNPDLEAVSTDQELMIQPLPIPIPVPGSAPLVAGPATGFRPPPGGNSLPPSGQIGQSGQQVALDTEVADLTQSTLLARTAPPAPAVLQHPANHPLADGQAQPLPVPEFMEQLAKFPKPAPGIAIGGMTPGLIQGMSDIAMSASETDVTGAELIRGTAVVAAPERQVAAQPAPTVLPLSRLAGAPGWDQGLGQRILWMVDNGLNRAELRLDPPHLGTVNVRISMQDDQATLLFQAAHPAAREALESAMPRLREMFAQQGLELGGADVSDQNDQAADDGGGREPEQLTNSFAGRSGNESAGEGGDELSSGDPGVTKAHSQSTGNSLIDEFV